MPTRALIHAVQKAEEGTGLNGRVAYLHMDGAPEDVIPKLLDSARRNSSAWTIIECVRRDWSSLMDEPSPHQDRGRYGSLDDATPDIEFGYRVDQYGVTPYVYDRKGQKRALAMVPWPEYEPQPPQVPCWPLNTAVGTPCPEEAEWSVSYLTDEDPTQPASMAVCTAHLLQDLRELAYAYYEGPHPTAIWITKGTRPEDPSWLETIARDRGQ